MGFVSGGFMFTEQHISRNLLPAATKRVYPGYFSINTDRGGFCNDPTWPGHTDKLAKALIKAFWHKDHFG